MTSLPEVSLNLETIENATLDPRAKEDMGFLLEDWPTTSYLIDWRESQISWIQNQAACTELEVVCVKVAEYLHLATTKAVFLRLWALGEDGIDGNFVFGDALNDIKEAFSVLEVVPQVNTFKKVYKKKMLLEYLRQTFEVAITFTELSSEPVGEAFASWWSDILDTAANKDLTGFRFSDPIEDALSCQIQVKPLSGVAGQSLFGFPSLAKDSQILLVDQVYRTCLSAYPPSPFLN